MEKIDFVNYRALAREVRDLRVRLDVLEARLYAPSGQRYTATPGAASGNRSTMADAVVRHVELESFYAEKLAEKASRLLEIERALDALEDPAEREIMRYRYIDGFSWRRIIELLRREGYSERQVYRLHGFALLKLKEI